MERSKTHTLPLLALPKGSVLLPGTTIRISVSGRPDIPAFLSAVYTKTTNPRPEPSTTSIGCVPINSPLLRSDGQRLLGDRSNQPWESADDITPNTSQIDHRRLFMYGTEARILGVQGHKGDDLALIVEGIRRIRIERFVQTRPLFVAEVAYLDGDIGDYAVANRSHIIG